MAENADHRKLTAILCADVKGYSKLMGEDESYTVSALKERRKLFAENKHGHILAVHFVGNGVNLYIGIIN